MNQQSNLSVLFLGKKDDALCAQALRLTQDRFSTVESALGQWGDPPPSAFASWKGDVILSYLSRWVVPESLIQRAQVAALNFHPASPEYPGIGCNNFALYENVPEYGVTCHHMAARVDTGKIVAVRRFAVDPQDTVATLLDKSYAQLWTLFQEIVDVLSQGAPLPQSDEHWTRPPFTRKQFNELFRVTPDMPAEEMARRVRATSFGPYQPYVELAGFRFVLKQE